MVEDSLATREAIYADLLEASEGGDRPLSRDFLLNYTIGGERFPLIDAQGRGIRNPSTWNATLSITTVERGPYADHEIEPGVWHYPLAVDKHGRLDPSNRKYENALDIDSPVIYFYKPLPRVYLLVGLVRVASIDRGATASRIELISGETAPSIVESELERFYVKRLASVRLHQRRFREIVLEAYEERCAVCALPSRELLDGAHIRSDKDPIYGQPVIQNGLALCAIHHRAYDTRIIGIDGDLNLHVRPSALAMEDGPTFEHSIKALDRRRLAVIPSRSKRPDPDRLELTYRDFLRTT